MTLTSNEKEILGMIEQAQAEIFGVEDTIEIAMDQMLSVTSHYGLDEDMAKSMRAELSLKYMVLQNTLFTKLHEAVEELIMEESDPKED